MQFKHNPNFKPTKEEAKIMEKTRQLIAEFRKYNPIPKNKEFLDEYLKTQMEFVNSHIFEML